MNIFSNIKTWGIVAAIVIIVSLFSMWRIASNNYKTEKISRENAEQQLLIVQEENNKLLAYNKKIEKEMKEIEKEYKERFQNIPQDSCGDTKPSKELLEFFRQGE